MVCVTKRRTGFGRLVAQGVAPWRLHDRRILMRARCTASWSPDRPVCLRPQRRARTAARRRDDHAGRQSAGRRTRPRNRTAPSSSTAFSDGHFRESLRISRRRAPRRGRVPARDRRGGRHAFLLLFDGDADPPLPRLPGSLRRARHADLLCDEGELQPVGDPHLRRGGRRASTSSRRANCAARSPPAARPSKIVFAGVGKTAREIAFAIDTGILCFNVDRSPNFAGSPRSRRPRADGHGRHPHQSGRRRQDPRQDHHRQGREQVRHPLRCAPARSMPRRRSCRASRSRGVDMHIGSQITDLAPFDAAYGLLADLVRDAPRRRPRHRPCRCRRRPRHPLPPRRPAAARARRLWRDHPPPPRQSRRPHPVRARPRLRRQCRHPRQPRSST